MAPSVLPAVLSLSLVLCLVLCSVDAQADAHGAQTDAHGAPPITLRTLVVGACAELQRHAESVVGTGAVRSAAEFLETVVRFLAEAAASGLNVIAVYVTEILRVTGFDAALTLPRFTPEGVRSFAQWGVLCLLGYWLLAVVLRVLLGVLRQTFWVLRTVLSLWFFGLIVSDRSSSPDTTAVRLSVLVLVCVLLSLLGSGSERRSGLEQRLVSLEGRLKAVEKRRD